MQNILILPIAAATCVATLIGGWVGISLRDRLHLVLAFSAGAVIGVAFFDLLPESHHAHPRLLTTFATVAGAACLYVVAQVAG